MVRYSDVPALNVSTPTELLDAGNQLALKKDIWSEFSIEKILQFIKDKFGFDIPNWDELMANFGELRKAVEGTYTGTDPALLAIQATIGVIRRLAGGIVEPWRIPLIPLSHIGQTNPNLLENGGFDGPNPIDETEGWSLDTVVGRTSPGSARTYGDGTRKVLLSNTVPCTPEQKFDIGGFVTWSMLTGGGTGAMKLSVVAYDATDSQVDEQVIAQIDSPSGASAWTGMLGQYIVPAGAAKVRVQVEVAASVTGGTINFDDLSVVKYGTMPQNFITDLIPDLGNLQDGIAGAIETIGSFFDRLTGQPGTTFADLQSWAEQLKIILSGGTVGSGIFPTLDNGLVGSVADVQDFAQQILDRIVQAIRGIPVVGAGLADLFDDVESLRQTADVANATAITADTKAVTAQSTANGTRAGLLQGWAREDDTGADPEVYAVMSAVRAGSAQSATPAYVGNETDMPTFPRIDLHLASHSHTNPSSTGSTTAGGDNHSHSMGDPSSTGGSGFLPTFTPADKRAIFTPIWSNRYGRIDRLRFIAGGDGWFNTGLSASYLAIYRFNRSGMDGTLNKIWDSGDVKDSTNVSARQEFSIQTGLTTAGDIDPTDLLFVASLQVRNLFGSGRPMAGIPQGGIARSSDVLLRAPSYYQANVSVLPTSVNLSALSMDLGLLPWMAVSVSPPVA